MIDENTSDGCLKNQKNFTRKVVELNSWNDCEGSVYILVSEQRRSDFLRASQKVSEVHYPEGLFK